MSKQTKSLGVGVVGCGFVGRGAHVPAFSDMAQAELVAVADPDPNRRNKAAQKHRVRSSYQDFADLVQDPEVQLVVVAVPTPLHAQVALAAIEAGKHVLCEMPLAVDLEEAEKVVAAARAQGVVLMPSLTLRFTPNFAKVKQLLLAGAVGRPTALWYREFIPAADLAGQWPPGSWMWDIGQSGGPLFTLSVWSIDLFRWLADADVEQVDSQIKYTPLEKLGTTGYEASISLKMSNGMVGSMQYSGSACRSSAGCVLEITGDSTAMLRAVDNDRVVLLSHDPDMTEWNVKQPGPRMWGHQQQDEHLVDCIIEGRQPDIQPEDGLRAMEIAGRIAPREATVRAPV